MGRACKCCGDCRADSFYFLADRYRPNVRCFFEITQQQYKVVYDDGKFRSSKKISKTKFVSSGYDEELIVCNAYSKDLLSSKKENVFGKERITSVWLKTSIIRRLALEFPVDDIYDFDDNIQNINLRLGNDIDPDSDFKNFVGFNKYRLKVHGALLDKGLPNSKKLFDRYLDDMNQIADNTKIEQSNAVDVEAETPKSAGSMMFFLTPLYDKEVVDPILDNEDPLIFEGATFAQIGKWAGTDINNIVWLEFFRNNRHKTIDEWINQYVENIEYDWHNCFYRPQNREYISNCRFLNNEFNMTEFLDFDYFKRGGQIELEIFKSKTDNTKVGARQTYFKEIFGLYAQGFHKQYVQAEYIRGPRRTLSNKPGQPNDGASDFCTKDFVLDQNALDELKKCFIINKSAVESYNPVLEVPNDDWFWNIDESDYIHEIIAKPDAYKDLACKGKYSGDNELDPYLWHLAYGDYVMSKWTSNYPNLFDPPADGAFHQKQFFTGYYSGITERGVSNLDYIDFFECVILTPSAAQKQSDIVNVDPYDAYYERVPFYARDILSAGKHIKGKDKEDLKFKPANFRFQLLSNVKYYPGVIEVLDVKNTEIGVNLECTGDDCPGGPGLPEWRLIQHEFDDVGEPEDLLRIEHNNSSCTTVIQSDKLSQKFGGKLTISDSQGVNVAYYEPSVDTIFHINNERIAPAFGGVRPTTDDEFKFELFRPKYSDYSGVRCPASCGSPYFARMDFLFHNPEFSANYGSLDSYLRCFNNGTKVQYNSFVDVDGYRITQGIGSIAPAISFLGITQQYISSNDPGYTAAHPDWFYSYDAWEFTVVETEPFEPDNTYEWRHEIEVKNEPFVQSLDFGVFRSNLPTKHRELILGIVNEIVDDEFTFVEKYEFENVGNYLPGMGIRFRLRDGTFTFDSFFDCVGRKSEVNDFNILYQQWVPVLKLDNPFAIDSLVTQQQAEETAAYITDFDYWYKVDGFVVDENGTSTEKLIDPNDGQVKDFKGFRNPYYFIDGAGNLNGPFTSSGFTATKPNLAIYDDVTIRVDGQYSLFEDPNLEEIRDRIGVTISDLNTDYFKAVHIKDSDKVFESNPLDTIQTDVYVERVNREKVVINIVQDDDKEDGCGEEVLTKVSREENRGFYTDPGEHVQYGVSISYTVPDANEFEESVNYNIGNIGAVGIPNLPDEDNRNIKCADQAGGLTRCRFGSTRLNGDGAGFNDEFDCRRSQGGNRGSYPLDGNPDIFGPFYNKCIEIIPNYPLRRIKGSALEGETITFQDFGSYRTEPGGEFDNVYTKVTDDILDTSEIDEDDLKYLTVENDRAYQAFDYEFLITPSLSDQLFEALGPLLYNNALFLKYKKTVSRYSCSEAPRVKFSKLDLITDQSFLGKNFCDDDKHWLYIVKKVDIEEKGSLDLLIKSWDEGQMTTYLTLVGFINQMKVDILNDINDVSGPAIIPRGFDDIKTYQDFVYGNDSGTYQTALNYYLEVQGRLGLTDSFNLFASKVLLGDDSLRSLFRSGWPLMNAYSRTVDRIYFTKDLEEKTCGGESKKVQPCPDPLNRKKFDIETYFPSIGVLCNGHVEKLKLTLDQIIYMEKVDAMDYKFEIGILPSFKP